MPLSDWVDQSGYTLEPQTQRYCNFAKPERRITSLAETCITLPKASQILSFLPRQLQLRSVLFLFWQVKLSIGGVGPLVRAGLVHPLELGMQRYVSEKRVLLVISA